MEMKAVKRGYKLTEVGVIPEDWEVHSLTELGSFKNGINKGKEAFGHGFPLVNLMDVFGVTSISTIDHLGLINSSNAEQSVYDLKQGDVLFIRSSVKPSGVGLTAVVKTDLYDTVFSGFLIRFRDFGTINLGYKSYCFHDERFRSRIIASSTVSANTNINQDSLKQLQIPLPPTLEEQEAIAGALSDVDALISALESLIAKKRHIKQGAMQQLLRPKEGWVEKKLGDVLTKIVGGGTPSRAVPHFWNGSIPWMTVKDFAQFNSYSTLEYISLEGLKSSASHLIPKGTIITSTRMGLGKAVIFDVDVSINQDLKALFPIYDICTNYLLYWFQHNECIIADLGSGSTVMGISLGDLRKIPFFLPTKKEQTAIATILSDMDAEIAALETRLAKTRLLKQGMMAELLTGKTRLVNPATGRRFGEEAAA